MHGSDMATGSADVWQWFVDHGVLGIIVLAGLFAMRYVFTRLFAEEKGIFTRVANRHIEFVDSLRDAQSKNTEILERQTMTLNEIKDLHKDTNETASQTADSLAKLVEAHSDKGT